MNTYSANRCNSQALRTNLSTRGKQLNANSWQVDFRNRDPSFCRQLLTVSFTHLALIKALAVALMLIVSMPPVYAGSAGEALAKNGFSKKAQDAADEVQALLKKMLANHHSQDLGVAANLVDRLNNPDDICKLAATELPRLMKFLLIRNRLTNETALEYQRLRLMFETLQKECHDRKAALNPTLADQVKEHAAGNKPKTDPPPEDNGEDDTGSEPEIPDSERPEFDGWTPSDFACRSACDKHYESYKAEIDWYNFEIESMNKALKEFDRLNVAIESLKQEVEDRESKRSQLSGGDKLLNEIRIGDAKKKIESTRKLRKNALDIANRKREAATTHLAKAEEHWQALIECIKQCYKTASAKAEARPDNARGFYGPYKHDPMPGRRSDYEEGTRVPAIGEEKTPDSSPNGSTEKSLDAPSEGPKTTSGTLQPPNIKDKTPEQIERENNQSRQSFGMLQTEALADFSALSPTANSRTNVVRAVITFPDPGLTLESGSYINAFIDLGTDRGISFDTAPGGIEHVLRNYPVDQISIVDGKITLPNINIEIGDARPDLSALQVFVSSTPLSLEGDPEPLQLESEEFYEAAVAWPWSDGEIGGVASMDCPERVDFRGNSQVSFVCVITSTGTAPIDVEYSLQRVRGDAYVDGTNRLSESIALLPNESISLEFSVSRGDMETSTWAYRATTGFSNFVDNITNTALQVTDSTGDIVFVDDNSASNAGLDRTILPLQEIAVDPVVVAPTNVDFIGSTQRNLSTDLLR